MELKDTIELMESEDYKDRFIAEYAQTKIRVGKLEKMLRDYEAKILPFEPTCEIDLLKRQAEVMNCYLTILEYRADEEGINVKELF